MFLFFSETFHKKFQSQTTFLYNSTKHSMHGKSTVKSLLKLLFLIFQAFLFIFGIATAITTTIFYLKERVLLGLPVSTFILSISLSILHILSAILGFISINSQIKVRVAFYILAMLALINLEVVLIIKSSKMDLDYLSMWNKMSKSQKKSVEESFECCGFEEMDCDNKKGCKKVFQEIGKSFGKMIMKFLVGMVFADSLSLALLTLLKLRK